MLHTSALLVTLRLSTFAPKRKDKRVTAAVLKQHGVTSADLGAWSTTLLPAHATQPMTSLASRIRKWHGSMTLCWDRDGTALLPNLKYFDYQQEKLELEGEWDTAVAKFCREYPDYLAEAKRTLNGLFNPALYPASSEVHRKFAFRVDMEPIPDAADFRIALSHAERADLQRQMEVRLAEAAKAAETDLLQRVAEPLTKLIERLANPDKTVKDPLIKSLGTVLDSIDAYNVTDNPAIRSLRDQIRGGLMPYTASQLTHDASLRSAAAERAQAIMEQMEALYA